MKKSILTILVLFAPIYFSIIILSCNNKDSIFEIVGQEIMILQEGSYSNVLLNIHYKLNEISINEPSNSNSILSPLLAASPSPINIITLVTDLSITSSVDYNSDFPAGSELLSILRVELYPDANDDLSFPIKIGDNRGLFLYLKEAPAIDIVTTFEITTTLDNGRVFTSQSQLLEIKI